MASASPRRQELLKLITANFFIEPANISETVPDIITAENTAEYLAVQKGKDIAKQHPQSLVISADTTVVLGGTVLGKPKSKAEAELFLALLSGKTHTVYTGCALFYNGKSLSFSEETQVEFYELSVTEIQNYVNSGEPMDKAGAYGIQGSGSLLIKGIKGDYYNVMGLPVARLKREIEKFIK